jgi:hypothetical protein
VRGEFGVDVVPVRVRDGDVVVVGEGEGEGLRSNDPPRTRPPVLLDGWRWEGLLLLPVEREGLLRLPVEREGLLLLPDEREGLLLLPDERDGELLRDREGDENDPPRLRLPRLRASASSGVSQLSGVVAMKSGGT